MNSRRHYHTRPGSGNIAAGLRFCDGELNADYLDFERPFVPAAP
jgi:hypothetical protein